jgi:bacteriocin-like protein
VKLKEKIIMNDEMEKISEEELEKISGGVCMQFPDGWYVCTDDKERRQVYGPFKDEEKAWSVAAKNGYSYESIYGPVTAPAKER